MGESCKDEYHFGEITRISPEAPVPVFDFKYDETKLGMANNVKNNLESFGCKVEFISNDPSILIKRRFVDIKSNHQLLREDITQIVNPLVDINLCEYDFVVISDYDKGLLTSSFIEKISKKIKCPVFVDTKKKSISCFSYFKNYIIKCNETEHSMLMDVGDDMDMNLIVTKGKDGASWRKKNYPAPKVKIHDVTGAGDVFLASFSVIYHCTKNMDESIEKSILLASKSIQHPGIYNLSLEDILEICN